MALALSALPPTVEHIHIYHALLMRGHDGHVSARLLALLHSLREDGKDGAVMTATRALPPSPVRDALLAAV